MPAKVLKIALSAFVGLSVAQSDHGKSAEFLGDTRKLNVVACPQSLTVPGPFGQSSVRAVTIPTKGGAGGDWPCPAGSRNDQGKIKYTCINGNYAWTVGCYDCPQFEGNITLEGHLHEALVFPGLDGEEHHDQCYFGDTRYKHGAISFTCLSNKWVYVNTCSDTPCPTGTAKIDFGGGLGKVPFNVLSGSGMVDLDCPSDAPNPNGKVQLSCHASAAGNKNIGTWQFVSQTCQLCNPKTVNVTFDGHPKVVAMGGGALNDVFSTPCTSFDDGASYDGGYISYTCRAEGWAQLEVSCENYFCPKSTMNIHMLYVDDSKQRVHATTTITIDGGSVGQKKLDCPAVSKDPSKKIVVECQKSGSWKLISSECTGSKLQLDSTKNA